MLRGIVSGLGRSTLGVRTYAGSSFVGNFPAVESSTLDNMMRVSTANTNGDHVAVALVLNAGSAYETEGNNGLSGLLASIAERESRAQNGVLVSSFAEKENIGLVAQTAPGNVEAAVRSLRDALNEGVAATNLARHKQDVATALDDLSINSPELALDHLHSVAYQGTSLALPVRGSHQSLEALDAGHFADFARSHVTGSRAVLSAAGGVSHEAVTAAASAVFGDLPSKSESDFGRLPAVEYTGSMVSVRDDDTDRVSVAIAMKGVGHASPDYYTLRVIQEIAGRWNRQYGTSWNSSTRFTEYMKDEGNVASRLEPFTLSYHSTGLVGVYGETKVMDLEDYCYNVLTGWVSISTNATSTEVERAKARVKRQALADMFGSTSGLAQDVALKVAQLGHHPSPAEVTSSIDKIDKAAVKAAADRYLVDECPAVAALGQTQYLPDYNNIRRWSKWLRL